MTEALDSERAAELALRAKASEAYAQESRASRQEKLILDFLPLVRHVVEKIATALPRRMDLDELVSAGTLGLVRAARAYDPARGVEFKTYAYIRIHGAILDELRGKSFVPGAAHSQIRRLRQSYQRFQSEHGRPPGDEELAAALDMPLRQLYRLLEEARNQHFMSIHGLSDEKPALGSFLPPDGGPSPSDELERKELAERLAQAIQELPEKERLVLLLYYERDLTMKEAAEVLGVTESRVSQLHAAATFKLAMKLRTSV